MGGSISNRGHRHREGHGGNFWRKGEEFFPLTVEMITSDSWRSLTPTSQGILLDMLCHFWRCTRSDTELVKGGFFHTYRESRIDCSPRTFTASMEAIVARGWFSNCSGKRIVPRYRPGRWREYKDATLKPVDTTQGRTSKKKKASKCLGHFWQPGQVFSPISLSLLRHDSWRVLSPSSRCILLDMIHAYNAATFGDHRTGGINYTFNTCRVDCSENTFYLARAAVIEAKWFTYKADGDTVLLTPGPWRNFIAPSSAKLRDKKKTKARYLKKQKARLRK